MVTIFTRREGIAAGISDERLKWAVKSGRYIRLAQGVYFDGDRAPRAFERKLAGAMRSLSAISGELAAALHGFDGFDAPADGNYVNVSLSDVHQTLITIAATTTDIRWEWAMEWSLRHHHTTIAQMEKALLTHRKGNGRIRRVLALRPRDAPPTGSVLETMVVQLIRSNPGLPTPLRQVQVKHWQVDLAWPDCGIFLELDGEWHKDQLVYDAIRQTSIVATTGWLVGRYTWTSIVNHPNSTLRSLETLFQTRSLSRAG